MRHDRYPSPTALCPLTKFASSPLDVDKRYASTRLDSTRILSLTLNACHVSVVNLILRLTPSGSRSQACNDLRPSAIDEVGSRSRSMRLEVRRSRVAGYGRTRHSTICTSRRRAAATRERGRIGPLVSVGGCVCSIHVAPITELSNNLVKKKTVYGGQFSVHDTV